MTDSFIMPSNDTIKKLLGNDSSSNKNTESTKTDTSDKKAKVSRSHFHGGTKHSHIFPTLAHKHNNGAPGTVTSTLPRISTQKNNLSLPQSTDNGDVTKTSVNTRSNQPQANHSGPGVVTKTPVNTALTGTNIKKLERTKAIIKKYSINDDGIRGYVFMTNTEADAKYPGLKVFALMNPNDRKVYIADRGFKMYEGGYASLLAHEIEVHFQKQLMKGRWYATEQGMAMQEVEAYAYQLKTAKRFGMSKQHQDRIYEGYLLRQYDLLDEKHRALVNKGVFHYE